MNGLISFQEKTRILWRHFKFYLSRKIGYPLVEPDMLQLCFLFRCNLKCKMCNIQEKYEKLKGSSKNYELSFETIKDLIEQARNMRVKQFFLLGGEPFLREDLFDIIKFANSYRMKTLVFTNGTLLGNAKIIEKIFDSKLNDLVISIDGASENTYRDIRGEGIFEKIKNNIRLVNRIKKERKLSLPNISIYCTIMNQNIEELMDIVYMAKELELSYVGFQPVVADNTDARLRDSLDSNWVPEAKYGTLDKSIDKLLEYKLSSKENLRFISSSLTQLWLIKKYFRLDLSSSEQKCYMGLNRIVISQDAKMYFCAEDPATGEISFGDVKKDNLEDIWYSKKARLFRKSIKRCYKPCLLGGGRREEFDMLMDELFYNLYKRAGRFIKKDLLYRLFFKFI